MSTYENWMREDDLCEGSKTTRLNRIYDEVIVNPPNDAVDHWEIIDKWLKTAYICGKIDGLKEIERGMS